MAGIGFELKKIFRTNRLSSLFKVYGYSAILSSGPWLISIISILFIGIIKSYKKEFSFSVVQFQVVITYILAMSLILSSPFQLSFSRYVADKMFKKEEDYILPSYKSIIFILFVSGIFIALLFSSFFLKETSALLVIIFVSTLIMMSGTWIANSLLLGIKRYKTIFVAYFISYLLIILIAVFIPYKRVEWLLISFFIGNSVLFFVLSTIIVKNYPSNHFIDFSFITKKDERFMPCLVFASLFYNLGIWIDKFVFWFSESTGYKVISGLNASVVYDLPIFLAYISIVPGMAIFFYRIEADFAEKYEFYFRLVRENGKLKEIEDAKDEMIETLRVMIREIIIIQGIFNILIYYFSPSIFDFLNMPKLYLPLFYIDLVSTQIQLGLMAVLSVLHYLDKRVEAMWISFIFFISNFILSYLTIQLGPEYFGYGFGISVFISFIVSLYILNKAIKELEYETFMLI